MRKNYIDKLAFIEIRDRKILQTRSYGKDKWYTPGGKREGKETDEEALIREVKEELLVDIIPETIEYYGTFEAQAHGKPEGVLVRDMCYRAKYNGDLAPGGEIEEIDWFDYAKRSEAAPVDQLILDDAKAKNLID